MPKCGDGEDLEECNVKCIPSIGNKACITGVEEQFARSPTTLAEDWDCPACGADSEGEEESEEEGYIKRGRTIRKPDRGDKATRQAQRDAKRYQPWTPYYIGTVILEKLVQMTSFGLYVYSDNYRWGLFKSFMFFAISVKSMFSFAEFIRCECERRQRCLDKISRRSK